MNLLKKIMIMLLITYVNNCLMFAQSLSPCLFNPLCMCSLSAPKFFGNVQCHDFHLSTIPANINSSKIYNLSLRRNGLKVIFARSFHRTEMYRLEISENAISHLTDEALYSLERSLRHLDVHGNGFGRIPTSALSVLHRLNSLNANNNQIIDISPNDFPENLKNTLKSLSLSRNSLRHIKENAFETLQALEHLDLSGNNIYSIHELAFRADRYTSGVFPQRSLQLLNLSGNTLKKIPFQAIYNLSRLRILILTRNLITSTSDVSVKGKAQLSLDELNLEENAINVLTPYAFRNFVKINRTFIGYNPIHHIADGAFRDAKISHIHLNGCEMSNLSYRVWKGIESDLITIDLSYNSIPVWIGGQSNQSANSLSFPNLRSITLDGNKIDINMSMRSLSSSQDSLQQLSLKGSTGGFGGRKANPSFNPSSFNINFRNLRHIALSSTKTNRVSKEDLQGFGPNIEILDLSAAYINEIIADAFEYTPSVKNLNLSHNAIRRIDAAAFKVLGHTLLTIDLHWGLAMKTLNCDMFRSLSSLTHVNLIDNDLQQLSSSHCFRGLANLRTLLIDFNSLRVISSELLNDVPNLAYLFMAYNKLEVIDTGTFNDMEHLIHLDVSFNCIRHIRHGSFTNLKSLLIINLEGNDIEHIDAEAFQNIPRLELLNLAYNKIKQLGIYVFDQIGTLGSLKIDISYNHIDKLDAFRYGDSTSDPSTVINWLPLNNVKVCTFVRNNISYINGSFFDSMRDSLIQLSLSHNVLRNITSSMVSRMQQLQTLSLSANQIDMIHPAAFMDNSNMQILDLSYNNIDTLSSGVFNNTYSLRLLNLSFNNIRGLNDDLFRYNSQLEVLDLSHNKLSFLPSPTLRPVTSTLKELFCQNNDIRFINHETVDGLYEQLMAIDLSGNAIFQLSDGVFRNFHNLMSLNLAENPISNLHDTFDGLEDTLQELSLASMGISVLTSLNLPKLQYLNLSLNQIPYIYSISLSNCTDIRVLDLSNNRFQLAPHDLWNILPDLRQLYLSGNPIISIVSDSFFGLNQLEQLHLNNIHVSSFHTGALSQMPSLRKLYITTFPTIPNFDITNLISDSTGLEELYIEVTEKSCSKRTFGGNGMPKRLKKITITGHSLVDIQDSCLSNFKGFTLDLAIRNTNVTSVMTNFFGKLGQTRRIQIDFRDNLMTMMGDMFHVLPYFSLADKQFVKNNRHLEVQRLLISGNKWICDCKLAFLFDWLKQLRIRLINHSIRTIDKDNEVPVEFEDELSDLNFMLNDLRLSQCNNYNGKNILNIFRNELRGCRRPKFANDTNKPSINVWILIVTLFSIFYIN